MCTAVKSDLRGQKLLAIEIKRIIEHCNKTFQAQNHVEKICISTPSAAFPEHMLVDSFPPVMEHVRVLDIGFYACKNFISFSFFAITLQEIGRI